MTVPDYLPEDHYAAIGKVAETWSSVELLIDMACWNLSGMSGEVGTCLTSQVSGHARKLDAYAALTHLRGGDQTLCKKLNKFAEKARGLAERRNRVVHDSWDAYGPDKAPYRMEVTARKRVVLKRIKMSTEEVVALASEIDDLWGELYAIKDETDQLELTSFTGV